MREGGRRRSERVVTILGRVDPWVCRHRVAGDEDVGNAPCQGGIRRSLGGAEGRCGRERRAAVRKIRAIDVGTQDRVLEAPLPGDVIGVGRAVEAIQELGKPDERQGHFGAAVPDDVVDVEVGRGAQAVFITMVEAHPVAHLLHDEAGQGPDLVVAQRGEARPGVRFDEVTAVADGGTVGADGAREAGVVGRRGFQFVRRAQRVTLRAREQGRPGGHRGAVHVEGAIRQDRPGDAPMVAEHPTDGFFIALGEEPGARIRQPALARGEIVQHGLQRFHFRHVGSPADDGRRAGKEETVEEGHVRHPAPFVVRDAGAAVRRGGGIVIAVERRETLADLEKPILVAEPEIGVRILGQGERRRQRYLRIDRGGHPGQPSGQGTRLAQPAEGLGADDTGELDHVAPGARP